MSSNGLYFQEKNLLLKEHILTCSSCKFFPGTGTILRRETKKRENR